jgi:hypothetical protein
MDFVLRYTPIVDIVLQNYASAVKSAISKILRTTVFAGLLPPCVSIDVDDTNLDAYLMSERDVKVPSKFPNRRVAINFTMDQYLISPVTVTPSPIIGELGVQVPYCRRLGLTRMFSKLLAASGRVTVNHSDKTGLSEFRTEMIARANSWLRLTTDHCTKATDHELALAKKKLRENCETTNECPFPCSLRGFTSRAAMG